MMASNALVVVQISLRTTNPALKHYAALRGARLDTMTQTKTTFSLWAGHIG